MSLPPSFSCDICETEPLPGSGGSNPLVTRAPLGLRWSCSSLWAGNLSTPLPSTLWLSEIQQKVSAHNTSLLLVLVICISCFFLFGPFGSISGEKGDKCTLKSASLNKGPGRSAWNVKQIRHHLSTLLPPQFCLNPRVVPSASCRGWLGSAGFFPAYLFSLIRLLFPWSASATLASFSFCLLTFCWSITYTEKNACEYTAQRSRTNWKHPW